MGSGSIEHQNFYIEMVIQSLYNVYIMSNTLLSIRMDDKTKKEIKSFADSLGLSVSAFVTTVLRQTMQEGKVILTPNFEPTPYLQKVIKKADADLKAGLASPALIKKEARNHLESLMKE